MRAFVQRIPLVVLATALAAACSTARAAAPIERPALEVPPPPPRVIIPLPPPEMPSPEPVGDLPANANGSAPQRPRPQRDRSDSQKPADPKPEAPPVEQQPPPAVPPPAPSPQLRMPETANAAQLGGQIRETIDRARAILGKTDYGPLSEARKKNYTNAQLFAQQAEEALKASNLVAAKELAEKAERLAKELQGR